MFDEELEDRQEITKLKQDLAGFYELRSAIPRLKESGIATPEDVRETLSSWHGLLSRAAAETLDESLRSDIRIAIGLE